MGWVNISLNFLRINLYQILWIVFASFLMFIQFYYSSDWKSNYPTSIKISVILSFIVYIFVQILNIKDNIDKVKLNREVLNWRKEASLLLESHLYWFSKKMNFWADNNWFVNRISIYKKDNHWFYCIGRHSDSIKFKNKSTKIYLDKWILFEVWDKWNRWEKGYFDNKVIDNNRRNYRNYHKRKYWLTDNDLDKLHMKSLLYYWYRIEDDKWLPQSVILFESTKRDKFSNEDLDSIFKDNIPPLVHVLKFILPNITKPLYDNNKQL